MTDNVPKPQTTMVLSVKPLDLATDQVSENCPFDEMMDSAFRSDACTLNLTHEKPLDQTSSSNG